MTTAEKERTPETAENWPNLAETRKIVADLMTPRPAVYWIDLSFSAAIGWIAFVLAVRSANPSVMAAGILVAGFAFLRAVLFVHEISHFRRGVMRGFETAWNLLIGIPLALPSFMYQTHADHHKRHLYGTARDPEYLPLGLWSQARLVRFVLEMFLVPPLLVVRYGVLSPLSWIIFPLRGLVVGRASALVINPAYVRAPLTGAARREFFLLELGAFLWLSAWAFLLVTGRAPMKIVWVYWAATCVTAVVNQIRTLTAHLYVNEGAELTVVGQLLDSINVRGIPLLTDLVFPVGLKYHALHHFIPDMPYHGLAEAHRRLMDRLPDDAPYKRTEKAGLFAQLQWIWRRTGQNGAPAPK